MSTTLPLPLARRPSTIISECRGLSVQQKCNVINAFWPHLKLEPEDYVGDEYVDLFDFLEKTFQSLRQHRAAFVLRGIEDLIVLIKLLCANRRSVKEDIVKEVENSYLNAPVNAVLRSIELASRVWLGIHISCGSLSVGPGHPQDTPAEWQNNQTLEALVVSQFSQRRTRMATEDFPLDDSFTAVNIKKICRLYIRWTDNLIDHLQLKGSRGQRTLSVYRHKICLVNHLKDPSLVGFSSDILEEAIRTFDLLFPFGDSQTAEFLEAEGVHFYTILGCGQPRPIDLGEFQYWRNNLVRLWKLLNGPPESLAQTLFDTRNISQFATLWVAIVGVFSLTIIFGILATVYSIKQYYLAIASYNLALALACHEFPELAGYCVKT
jgi:hypothetical protein